MATKHPFQIIDNAGEIRDGQTLTRVLVDLAQAGCLIAEPIRAGIQIPPDHVVQVTAIQTDGWARNQKGEDVSQHWESFSTRGSFASPTKALLDQLAAAAGLTTVENTRVPADEGIAWSVVVERVDLSGATVRTPGDRAEGARERDAVSKAQSRARKRAICAALGVGTKYPLDIAGAYVVTCRLVYRPVAGLDAEFDRAARLATLAQRTGLGTALYGARPTPQIEQPSSPETPPAQIEEPQPAEQERPAPEPAEDLGVEIRELVRIARGKGRTDEQIANAAHAAHLDRKHPTREAVEAFVDLVMGDDTDEGDDGVPF